MDQPQSNRRLLLDKELREILQENLHYTNIYFQPPTSVQMKYDCFRYSENTYDVKYADNKSYIVQSEYTVIFITRDPDSPIPRIVQEHFKCCYPGRKYVSDNLYHFPFTIYF